MHSPTRSPKAAMRSANHTHRSLNKQDLLHGDSGYNGKAILNTDSTNLRIPHACHCHIHRIKSQGGIPIDHSRSCFLITHVSSTEFLARRFIGTRATLSLTTEYHKNDQNTALKETLYQKTQRDIFTSRLYSQNVCFCIAWLPSRHMGWKC